MNVLGDTTHILTRVSVLCVDRKGLKETDVEGLLKLKSRRSVSAFIRTKTVSEVMIPRIL